MTEQQVAAPPSPYKGLAPFEDSSLDALFFFGREREREIVTANLLAYRLTVLYGASGVGKSSLLQAGVAYELRRKGEAVVVFNTWSGDPGSSVVAGVRETLAASFPDAVVDDSEERLSGTLAAWTAALGRDLYLIFDQLDEYFLYHEDDQSFAEELAELVTRPGLRVNVLLSIRDDMLSQLDRFKALIPNLLSNYLRLDHLDRRSAREAILGPLDRYNTLVPSEERVSAEPELVEAVLDQTIAGRVDSGEVVDRNRVEPPYLQLVMQRLWEEERSADSRTVRLETLERLGGAEEIVRAHLGEALESLSPEDRDLAARLFNHLVTPSGTKIAHEIGDLAQYASVSERDVAPVLATLVDERIVRPVSAPGQPDGSRYEIFHDVLAEPVAIWRARHEAERELERTREKAHRRNRRLLAVTIASLIAVAAMVLVTVFALAQRREAQRQREEAQAQARKTQAAGWTATASSLLATDPQWSLSLAVQAARIVPNRTVENVLREAILASPLAVIRLGKRPVNDVDLSKGHTGIAGGDDRIAVVFRWSPPIGKVIKTLPHGSPIKVSLISQAGTLAVTAGGKKSIVWNLQTGSKRVLLQRATVSAAALTPDAAKLATGGSDGHIYIWDLSSGDRVHDIAAGSAVKTVEFNVDGNRLLVVLRDGHARLYDVATGEALNTFESGRFYKPQTQRFVTVTQGRVNAAALSRSGNLAVTAGKERVFVWDLESAELSRFVDASGDLLDVAFSPRGCCFVTASADGTAIVWKASRDRLSTLPGHTGQVRHASYSPDGRLVVTASADSTARVWNAATGDEFLRLAGHGKPVNDAEFSPKGAGAVVATAGADGTVRLWDGRPEPSLVPAGRMKGTVTAIAVAPDGRRFVAGTSRGRASIWQFGRPRRLATIPARGAILAASFAPDPLVLASGPRRSTIWNVRTGRPIRKVEEDGPATAGALTADGGVFATAQGHDVRVSGAEGQPAQTFTSPAFVTAVALTRDGRRLAVAGKSGLVVTWNLVTGKRLSTCRAGAKELKSVSFDSTGDRVLTSSHDHAVRVCDVRTNDVRSELRWHNSEVRDVAFSADGRWIATAGPRTAGLGTGLQEPLFRLPGHRKHTLLSAVAWSPHDYRIVTGDTGGGLRTYVCHVCGGVPELLRLAGKRLAKISPH